MHIVAGVACCKLESEFVNMIASSIFFGVFFFWVLTGIVGNKLASYL